MNKLAVAAVKQVELSGQPHSGPMPRPAPQLAPRSKCVALAMVALLFLSGVAVVAQAVKVNAMGYQLAQIRRETASLEQSNERLELAVARMKDPGQLAQLARNRLGLTEPDAAHVVRLSPATLAGARVAIQGQEGAVPKAGESKPEFWQALARVVSQWLAAGRDRETPPLARR